MEGSETGGAWVGTGLGREDEGSETGGAWVGDGLSRISLPSQAEFDTDHFLLVLDLRQAPEAFTAEPPPAHESGRPGRLHVSRFQSIETCQAFADMFAELRESHDGFAAFIY